MSESNAKKEMAPVRRTADELSVVTRSQPQTVAVGRALGECLAEGDVLVLTGDLGAGKTQLTKGMAAGLGITASELLRRNPNLTPSEFVAGTQICVTYPE